MENWILKSGQKNKYLEVVNTDDYVNLKYMFGGKKGMETALQAGSESFIAWLADEHMDQFTSDSSKSVMARAIRIMQLYPEVALAAFLKGAARSQLYQPSTEANAAVRLGNKAELATDPADLENHRTLRVVHCDRRLEWDNEYLGKSHSEYVGINMGLFWSSLRSYEDTLYRFYSSNSLRVNNKLRIIGLFTEVDKEDVIEFIRSYDTPIWKPSKSLLNAIFKQKN